MPLPRHPVRAPRTGRPLAFALGASLLALASTPWAQRIRLSAPLDLVPAGSVLEQRVSADGSFLVYAVDLRADGRARLVRAELEGAGTTLDLGVELPEALASRFEIEAHGARVVYLSHVDRLRGLFSVPSDGSAPPVRLDPSDAGSDVESFQLTPDGTHVAYLGAQAGSGPQLYSVPIEGGPVQCVSALPPDGRVRDFQLGPDSQRVLYRASTSAEGGIDLYAGSLSGRQPAERLSQAHPSTRAVERYVLSADQREVVYSSDLRQNGRSELYAVSLLGGDPRLLSQPVVGMGVEEFALTHDGKAVVYGARTMFTWVIDLFRVPLAGGTPMAFDVGSAGNERIVAVTAQHVVFLLFPGLGAPAQLFSVAVDGSQPAVRLDPDGVSSERIPLPPGGARVVYRKGTSLFSAVLDGSRTPRRLGESSGRFVGYDSRGTRVVFGLTSFRLDGQGEPLLLDGTEDNRGDTALISGDMLLHRYPRPESGSTVTDLYRVPVDGSAAPVRVNPPFPPALVVDDVTFLVPAAAASRAAYRTHSGRLYGVALDGSESAVRIGDPLAGPLGQAVVSPDGTWVAFYQAGALLLARLDGSLPPTQIAADASPVLFTPDGTRLLYAAFDGVTSALWSLPLDGSAPAVRIEGSFSFFLQVTSDSARILYLGEVGGSSGLVIAPTDGSGTPLVVDFDPQLQGSELLLSPDGRHVVYRGQEPGGFAQRLYSIDLQVAAPPVALDDLPLAYVYAGFSPPVIDPSSRYVVYLARDGELLSLRRVAIEGGSPSEPLLDPFAEPGVDVLAFSSDGEHVILPFDVQVRSSGGGGFDFDVMAVPLDGSQATVQLNDGRAGPGTWSRNRWGDLNVSVPLFAGPEGRVLFPEGPRLISASLEGGPRAELTQELGDTVREVRFTPDGRLAVFELPLADGTGLYEAATDGSQPLRLLSGPSVPGARIGSEDGPQFVLTPDGAFAVYIADLDADEVFELFASPLGTGLRQGPFQRTLPGLPPTGGAASLPRGTFVLR